MNAPLDWDRDGSDWPLREHSRFVEAAGVRWHVQQLGQGPLLLMLHGTAGSTHTWRHLAPLLAPRFSLCLVDLPGHAFTSALPTRQMGLTGMAQALGRLMQTMGLSVHWMLGHSAGAAIGAQMILDGSVSPRALLGVNAALLPFSGLAGWIFPPAAQLLAATPLAARVFAWRASDPRAVRLLIEGTGSALDEEGLQWYGRLLRQPAHVAHVLAMMANWRLEPLLPQLHSLPARVALLAGGRDRAVPLRQAHAVLPHLPATPAPSLRTLGGVGHLAHEEDPEAVATWVRQQAVAPRRARARLNP